MSDTNMVRLEVSIAQVLIADVSIVYNENKNYFTGPLRKRNLSQIQIWSYLLSVSAMFGKNYKRVSLAIW